MTKSMEWGLLTEEQLSVIESHHENFPIRIGGIAKSLGLIVKKSTLAAGISGEIKEVEGVVTIRINRHDVKERQRFTLAHEIAHFLLHREKIGDGIVDDILYRSNLSDAMEQQANRLAADLIMPWDMVKTSLIAYGNLKIEEKIERISNELEVSTTAIKIRLGKL